MRNPTLVLAGIVAAGFGLVFFGQGISVITQIKSTMVGDPTWTVIGAIMAVFGIACIIAGARPRSRTEEDV